MRQIFNFQFSILKNWVLKNAAFLLTLGLVLIPFFFVWLRGRLFYDFDMTFITAPIEDMFARYQRSGNLPFWAPELQMGYPLIAISHMGFFYPLHIVLREFLPGVITLNISLFFHTILATVGMYLLLRQEKFQKQSSALGAFVFAGTGFFVGRYYLTNVILPLAWTPINLWLLGNWLKNKSYRSLLGLSIAIALQVLLGQPQAAMISAFSLVFYTIAHLFSDPKKTLLRILGLIPAALFTILLSYAQIGPTLNLVPYSDRADAMQPEELYEFNLPFYHLSSWIFPHAFGYQENYIGAKNETELSSWLGITLLTVIVAGVFAIKKMKKRPLVFSILLLTASLLMITGESSPLYRFLVENHFLDSLAIPARWILLLVIMFSFVAAHGAEYIAELKNKNKITLSIVIIFCLFGIAYLSLIAVPQSIRQEVKRNLFENYFKTALPFALIPIILIIFRKVVPEKIYLITILAGLEILTPNLTRNVSVPFSQPFLTTDIQKFLEKEPTFGERLFSQRDMSLEKSSEYLLHQFKRLDKDTAVTQEFKSTGSELRGIAIDLRWNKGEKKNIPIHVIVTDKNTGFSKETTISSLKIVGGKDTEVFFSSPFKNIFGHTFLVSIKQDQTKPGPWITYMSSPRKNDVDYLPGGYATYCVKNSCERISFKDSLEPDIALTPLYTDLNRIKLSQNILSPHIGASKKIPSTQWLGALQLKEVKRYLYEIGDQNENADGFNPFLAERRELLNRLSVGYLLGSYDKNRTIGDLKNISLINEITAEGQTVRLYKNLEVAPRVQFVTNVSPVTSPDGARAVLFDAKKPTDPVPVEDDTLLAGKKLSEGKAEIVSYEPNEVVIKTQNTGEGFLLLRDTYYPDWRVYIDDKETRIFPSEWIFRGVITPQGEHLVTFRFDPTKTTIALKISFIAWLFLALSVTVYILQFLFFKRRKYKLQFRSFLR